MQHPIVAAVEGGRSVDFDAEVMRGWAVIADACEVALTGLHPQHPERPAFLEMLRECRLAAGETYVLDQLRLVESQASLA